MTTQTATPPTIADFTDIVDTDAATWAYLNALKDDELRKELFPYVRARMAMLHRARVRAVENRVFGGQPDASVAPREPVDLMAQRYEFMAKFFTLPDGTRVEWVDATPEQFRVKAAWYRHHARGFIVYAERYEETAAFIEERGVTCLRDLMEEA